MSLNQTKKIVFTGPPNSGKTTIIKVFFERINPINIFNISSHILEPTRGAEINIYNLFNSDIGIFDLAGQENQDWYGEGKEIFENSDLVVLIFDVTTELKDIVKDVVSVGGILQKVSKDAKFYVILHKIDLKPKLYLIQKITYLKKWLEDKHSNLKRFEILTTSIKEDFFIDSYIKIQKIMIDIISNDMLEISLNDYKKYDLCLRLLLNLTFGVKYIVNDLFKKVRVPYEYQVDVISVLQYLDLVKIHQPLLSESEQWGVQIELTDNGNRIMSNLNRIKIEKDDIKKSESSETINSFNNFKKIFKDKSEISMKVSKNGTFTIFNLFNQIKNNNKIE